MFDVEENSKLDKYSQKLPDKLIYFFIDYLSHRGVKYLVAPHEADFQLAYMYKD